MNKSIVIMLTLGVILSTQPLFADEWKTDNEKTERLKTNATAAIQSFKDADPDIKRFFGNSYGWVIFPTVAKGGVVVGGGYGEGIVYEQGKVVGHSSLTQLTAGLQWGAQGYSEIIFFKDKATLDQFKKNDFKLGANASAVAATIGASADADFKEGLAIFTRTKGGLMYEATVAGQVFKYWSFESKS